MASNRFSMIAVKSVCFELKWNFNKLGKFLASFFHIFRSTQVLVGRIQLNLPVMNGLRFQKFHSSYQELFLVYLQFLPDLKFPWYKSILIFIDINYSVSRGTFTFKQKKQYSADISGNSNSNFPPDFLAISTKPNPAPPLSEIVVFFMISLYSSFNPSLSSEFI